MSTEEKVEMADVPLTTAVDGEKTNEQEAATQETKPKKNIFSNLFAKKQKHDALIDADESAEASKEKAKSPVRNWFACRMKKCHTTEHTDSTMPMTIGVNLLDRDEKLINEHIKLSFEDIMAEPDGYHSWDWVWKSTNKLFVGTRKVFYRLLAFIVAFPCALVWALIFALLTCLNVWLLTPLARALAIPAVCIAKVWAFLIQSIFDPIFRSCGLLYSNVHVKRYQLEPYDVPGKFGFNETV
ncbi:caveolin 1 [Trichuris trichiura]|uniref:Caveolin n=1 Tax=Trichuris trichiura TaxID=36087 RepID=A0A077YVZ9_TRITR|nr:caveolin 1 [Trichuris trichiura]